MEKKSYRFTNRKKYNDFLNLYVETGSISRAAKKCKISRQTHYDWMAKDESYARAFDKADKMAADLLEEEARRRAVDGVKQDIYYKGEKVGSRTVYSDTLLALMLKAKKPEYREAVDVSTQVNVNLSDVVQKARERAENGTETEDGIGTP